MSQEKMRERQVNLEIVLEEPGWHYFDEYNPPKPGKYTVINRTKTSMRSWIRNGYEWQGGVWWTPGKMLAKTIIEAYYDPETEK